MNEVQILVILESILQLQIINVAVGTFLCNFWEFRQFTIDSGENNAENNWRFFLFYILHLAHKFVALLYKLIILLVHSVSFFLYNATVP